MEVARLLGSTSQHQQVSGGVGGPERASPSVKRRAGKLTVVGVADGWHKISPRESLCWQSAVGMRGPTVGGLS